MPTNLHALIRYQILDKCLSNRFRPHTIHDLMVACSEAIAEKTGVYKEISERTIRDDIRVMRSDILGFNAPIKVTDGIYYYENLSFSINQTELKNMEILRDVLDIFKSNHENFTNYRTFELMQKIAKVLDVKLEIPKVDYGLEFDDLPDFGIVEENKGKISREEEVFNSFFRDKNEDISKDRLNCISDKVMYIREEIIWGLIFEYL